MTLDHALTLVEVRSCRAALADKLDVLDPDPHLGLPNLASHDTRTNPRRPMTCKPMRLLGLAADSSARAAKLGKALFPQDAGGQDLSSVAPQQPAVQVAMEALFPPLAKDDRAGGGAIMVAFEIEPASAAPGQLVRQFQGTMNRAAELIERLRDRISPDLRVGERHALTAARDLSALPGSAARLLPIRHLGQCEEQQASELVLPSRRTCP